MGKPIDLTGKVFNQLTVIGKGDKSVYGKLVYWLCQCSCSKFTQVTTAKLNNGHTKSCGCFKNVWVGDATRTHGLSNTREYKIWQKMVLRCHDPKNSAYEDYGARGITVCDSWRKTFINFYNDMGVSPSIKHTLDRIDNNQGYSPENCRWATSKEQANNTRHNRLITFNGETKTITEWATIIGINRLTLTTRIDRHGWSIEDAFTLPRYKKPHDNPISK